MKNRKGVISIQLNWMFVLIVGAIILTFFIVIVQKQRAYSEESIAGIVQVDLQAVFSSSHVSTGTASIVEIPNQVISYSCEGFKVGNQFAAKFPYAFAPDSIKSDRNTVSVYAYDWSVPYRVTNFLYVTSPDIKYIIYDDNLALATALEELLPPKYIVKDDKSRLFMNKEIGSLTDDMNNYKIRVIYFTDNLPNLAGKYSEKQKISALKVVPSCSGTPEGKLKCRGDLTFHNYNESSNGWSNDVSDYVGEASLLAAIFSEDKEIYECGMDNSFKRLLNVTKIYQDRTQDLMDYYGSGTCYEQLNEVLPILGNIYGAALSSDSIGLNTFAQQLESKNNDVIANSCPSIY